MEKKSLRKYNSDFRKNFKQKLTKLSNKNDCFQIYKIINSELENKITINNNGMYFNINLLSDKTIELINNYITDKNESDSTTTEHSKIIYESYNKDTNMENFISSHKLTNQEKSLIKKYRQKS
jgi:hypothetical protein